MTSMVWRMKYDIYGMENEVLRMGYGTDRV